MEIGSQLQWLLDFWKEVTPAFFLKLNMFRKCYKWQLHSAFQSPLSSTGDFYKQAAIYRWERRSPECLFLAAVLAFLANLHVLNMKGWLSLQMAGSGFLPQLRVCFLLPSQCLGEGKNECQYVPCMTARPASNLTTLVSVPTHFNVTVCAQLVASKVLLKALERVSTLRTIWSLSQGLSSFRNEWLSLYSDETYYKTIHWIIICQSLG